MVLRLTLALAACTMLTAAASAEEFAFSAFTQTVVIGSVSLDNAKVLDAPPVKTIGAGGLTIMLEQTRLEEVQNAFGGTIQNDGDAGNGIYWLCYAGADATLWFSSFMGMADGAVSQVTSEAGTGHAATSGCSKAPAILTAIDFGLPDLGAPLTELTAKFGKVEADVGLYSYSNVRRSAESPDFEVFQYLIVTAPEGKISGISVGQVTSN
jgi:hypothetical protein